MKKKTTAELGQDPATLLGATDFYNLPLTFPELDEEQLRVRPLGNWANSFKLKLGGRTDLELRAAAAELERVIEPVRFRGLTTRFRKLLYALMNADLSSINGFPAAKEEELIAVLGLLLLQEYRQIPEPQMSGSQSQNALEESEGQIFEAWVYAFIMAKIQNREDAIILDNYGSDVKSKHKSISLQGRLNAIQKNTPFRELEKEVIEGFITGRKVKGHPKFGKWTSAKQAGERIYAEMKAEHDKLAKASKQPVKKVAEFPLVDSNAAEQFGVYIRRYLRKERASEELVKIGILSTWIPEKNEFIPDLTSWVKP